jgi:hypothetical protein
MKRLYAIAGITLFLYTGLHAKDTAFEKTLKLQGVAFHVTAQRGEAGESTVVVTPSGLEKDNRKMERKIEGSVIDAQVADLNSDGSPEIYIYTVSDGSGAYGSLVAYSANKKRSLSDIYLPPLEEDGKNSRGYMGHDSFKIKDNVLVRTFPVYQKSDPNCCPTGGKRMLEYTLVPGEAGWKLKVIKSSTVAKQ